MFEYEDSVILDLTDGTYISGEASPEGGSPGEAATTSDTSEITSSTVSDVSFLDKPFSEYSTTDSLLLLLLACVVMLLIQNIFRRD